MAYRDRQYSLQTVILVAFASAVIAVLAMLNINKYYFNKTEEDAESVQQKQTAAIASPEPSMQADSPSLIGPQEFSGTLPCPGCSGILTDLTLQRNSDDPTEGTFVLIQTYEGKNTAPVTTLGKWDRLNGSAEDPRAIVVGLKPSNGDKEQYWLVVDNDTLRELNSQRLPLSSSLRYDLKRRN